MNSARADVNIERSTVSRSGSALGGFIGFRGVSDTAAVEMRARRQLPGADPIVYVSTLGVDQSTVVLFDGRIDDRIGLRRSLGLADPTASDAELFTHALKTWDVRTPYHVVGDYAAVVVCGRSRRILLMRDVIGGRQLYWRLDDEGLAFATNPLAVLAIAERQPRANLASITAWRDVQHIARDAGYFADVNRVPPQHVVEWRDGALRMHQVYRYEDITPAGGGSVQDHFDQFAATFVEAVECRLAGPHPTSDIATYCSSGLDSTAVTAVAADLLQKRNRHAVAFTAYAPAEEHESAPPGRHADERALAAMVCASRPNIRHRVVQVEEPNDSLVDSIERAITLAERPPHSPCNIAWVMRLQQAASAERLPIILTGAFGNTTFSYGATNLPLAYLKRGQLLAWLTETRRLARYRQRSWVRVMAGTVKRTLGAVRRNDPFTFDTRAERLWMLGFADQVDWKLEALRVGLDLRDPTLDRRLIELCLSIPEEQFHWRGEPRALARRFLRGRLPEPLLDTRTRGYQGSNWYLRLQRELPRIRTVIEDLGDLPAARDILDVDGMRRALNEWPASGFTTPAVIQKYRGDFLRHLSLGLFLLRYP